MLWALVAGTAWAGAPLGGEVAFAYGRNLGQRLNVAALATELKVWPDPRFAVGVRLAGGLGVALGSEGAKAYLGSPLLLKVEGSPSIERNRPFAGLGLGVTPTAAGGVVVKAERANLEGAAWGVSGSIPTLMPEIGVDLGGFRLALQYNWMLGSAKAAAASIAATGAVEVSDGVPGLDGLMVQLGAHLGGPKAAPTPAPVGDPAPDPAP